MVPLRTEAGNHVVLYFKLSNLICDGDAIRMLMNWKGAKAKLPCFCCMNVLSQEDEDDLPPLALGYTMTEAPGKMNNI